VDYELTERARDLLPVIAALGRWGYRWAWGPPRPGEAVDVGAILRSVCGLAVSPMLRGSVELVVTRGVDAEDIYVLHAADGTVTYEERTAPEADAHMLGPERAWVEAFGVDGSRTELEVTGDTRLAEALLDEARRLSPAGLTLHVNQDNGRALRFYEKHGFVIQGGDVNPNSGRPVYKMSWRP
jgi:GNAT superfamily N-acetyltransferase